jgi:hypothetical protein
MLNALKPVVRSGFDGEIVSKADLVEAVQAVQNITISQNNDVSASAPTPDSPSIVPNNIHLQNNNPDDGCRTPTGVRNQQESTFSIAGGDSATATAIAANANPAPAPPAPEPTSNTNPPPDDDSPPRSSVRVHAPPGGFSAGFW